MVSYLVSGATRGIGLALVERLGKNPTSIVFAGARNVEAAVALKEVAEKSQGRVQIVQLDPTSEESVQAAVKYIEDKQGSLDVLINNAGTAAGGFNGPLDTDIEALRSNFEINVVGVSRLTNAVLPLMRKSDVRHIFVVSSSMGCNHYYLERNMAALTAYGPTKAAATMLAVHFGIALKPEGFVVKPITPGWVKTDLGGPMAELTVEQSIDGVEKVITSTKKDDEIVLLNYDGSVVPW